MSLSYRMSRRVTRKENILQTITFGVVLLSLVIQYIVLSQYVKKVFPDMQ